MPALVEEIRDNLRRVFKTDQGEPVLFPGSGTGAWEAAIVNCLSPGERILSFNNGHFAGLWAEAARSLGVEVDTVQLKWGDAVTEADVQEHLKADHRAVLVVHNETSTGVTSDVSGVRRAIDRSGNDPLLLVDTVSSLASIDFRMDEWGVDVAVAGTQKGLMLPPGMGVLCASPRALEASTRSTSLRYFFDWRPVIRDMQRGFFPYTPATLLLIGMREALRIIFEEGLDAVLTRHCRLAEGVRRGIAALDLPLLVTNPSWASNTITAVVVDQVDSDEVVRVAAQRLNLALGVGLGKLKGNVFRIGHLGSLNELEVLATLAGTELALSFAGAAVNLGSGVAAAERYFAHAD